MKSERIAGYCLSTQHLIVSVSEKSRQNLERERKQIPSFLGTFVLLLPVYDDFPSWPSLSDGSSTPCALDDGESPSSLMQNQCQYLQVRISAEAGCSQDMSWTCIEVLEKTKEYLLSVLPIKHSVPIFPSVRLFWGPGASIPVFYLSVDMRI